MLRRKIGSSRLCRATFCLGSAIIYSEGELRGVIKSRVLIRKAKEHE
jgi:hypothetical protein